MSDRVITTFETTIAWFDPYDKLPENFEIVLVKIRNLPTKYIFSVCYSKKGVESYNWVHAPSYFKTKDVEWWAPIPKFGDEE